jgi:hypothetical protein
MGESFHRSRFHFHALLSRTREKEDEEKPQERAAEAVSAG